MLFQSTALAGTLVGVPMPFYAGRTYSRAYAQSASCSPAELQWETASGFSEAGYFATRNQDIMGEVLTCTIPSGADTTTPQYAYSGAYLALFGVGGGNPVSFYGDQHYVNTQSQWGWGSPSVVVTNYADINVSAPGSNIQIMGGRSSQATGTLRASTNQSNGLSVVSLGALNWSPRDENQQTGGGNAGKVTVTNYGAVSSTVGGGILALAKAGTSRYADGKNDSDYRYSGPVTVSSHASVSGDAFGIAALSVAGPGTYTSHKDYTAGGTSGQVTVKAYDSVSAGAGPAILAASYGGNTPFNKNQFVVKYSIDDGMSNDERYTRAYGAGGGVGGGVKVTVGTSGNPFSGQIVSKGAGQPGWSTRYNNFQFARNSGAGIMAISRGGDGLGRHREEGIYDYTTTFAGAPSAPVSISVSGTGNAVISTYGVQSPAVIAISQGGNSSGFKDLSVTGGNADYVSVSLAGAGRLTTSGAYSSGLVAQSLGGGGSNNKTDISQGGATGSITVYNSFSIVTNGDRSSGILAQSVSASATNGDYALSGEQPFVWGSLATNQEYGNTVNVTNSASIVVHGVDSHGILAQSIGGGGGVLHATQELTEKSYDYGSAVSPQGWQSVGGAASQSHGAAVTINNSGTITTYGGYSQGASDTPALGGGIAILAQSVGGGGGSSDGPGIVSWITPPSQGNAAQTTGGVGGATYDSSGSASQGGAVTVTNSADLTTSGSEAHGIVAQSIGGGGGHGRNKKGLFGAVGGTGGPGGDGGEALVNHEDSRNITVSGDYASGIIVQSVGGGGGVGGQATAWGIGISSATGGAAGGGGDGGTAKVVQFGNGGTIATAGYHGTALLVQSIGGGGGVGGNAKSTSASAGLGISIAHGGSGGLGGSGGSALAYTNGKVVTTGTDAAALVVQSIGGGGGNGGVASAKALTEGVPFDEVGNTVSLSISVAHGGSGGKGGNGGQASANVHDGSAISTSGDGAAGLLVQSIGGGGGSGGDSTATAVSKALPKIFSEDKNDEDAAGKAFNVDIDFALGGAGGSGGHGGQAYGHISGKVATAGALADGMLVQSIGGGGGAAGAGKGTATAVKNSVSGALTIAVGGSNGSGGYGGLVQAGLADGASVATTGLGSRGVVAQSIGGGGGSGGGGTGDDSASWALTIGLGSTGGSGGNGGNVYAWNAGTITTAGDDATGIVAQSIAGGGGTAGLGTSSLTHTKAKQDANSDSSDASDDTSDSSSSKTTTTNYLSVGTGAGGGGGTAGFVSVGVASKGGAVKSGRIVTTGDISHGILAQSIGGGGGAGATSNASSSSKPDVKMSLGMAGGNGGSAEDVLVYASDILTSGFASSAVVAQSLGGGGGVGTSSGFAVSSIDLRLGSNPNQNSGGGTGAEVNVHVLDGATLKTAGDSAHGVIAQSIGGGGGLGITALGTATTANDDTVSGVISLTLGTNTSTGNSATTQFGNSVTIDHNGTITTAGTRALGIVAQSIGGSGGFLSASAQNIASVNWVEGQTPAPGNNVSATLTGGTIVTSGDGAVGILAQSISGGGGGVGDFTAPLLLTSGNSSSSYGGGSAQSSGYVSVSLDAASSIKTTGANAHGILAQSLAGSGGLFMNNGSLYAGSRGLNGGTSNSGHVTVTVDGSVSSAQGWGVFAQTQDGTINVTVGSGGSITGTGASGVSAGAVYGVVTASGNTVLDNAGTVSGNVLSSRGGNVTAPNPADGTVALGAAPGLSLFLNQGTGTFVTGAIADVDGIVNAGTMDIGGEWNTMETTVTGDLVGVGTANAGSPYDAADLGLSTEFSPFSYYRRSEKLDWRTASASKGGLISGLDVDMEKSTADALLVRGDFAGRWGVDVNANALLPDTRTEFLKVAGQDGSQLSILPSLVFDFTDVTTSSSGWAGFSVASAHFADNGVSLGRNGSEASSAMQQAWDRVEDGAATEVKFGDDEISLGQVFGAFHQSTPENFSDMLLETVSQTAAAPLASSPSAAISAANSVLSCPAFETSGVMMDEGTCVWSRALGSGATQDSQGDASGYTQSTGGLQIGGQAELSDGWFLGSGLTYESSWFRNDNGAQKLSQDSFVGAVALKKEIGPWLFGLVGGGGYNWGDSRRYINLDTLSATATGNPDSAMFFGRFRASYEIALGDAYYMRPRVDLDVINMHQYGYTETGAGALNLMVDGNSDTAFGITPGIEFGARIPFLEDWPARLYGDLGVSFISADEWETTSRFAGLSSMESFSTFTPIADTVGHVTLGLDLAKRQGMELKLQYDGSFADDYRSHTGSLRFGYRF
nr:autotransporter outer membrane beta-barrel domain-containing protein [Martelella limonii]